MKENFELNIYLYKVFIRMLGLMYIIKKSTNINILRENKIVDLIVIVFMTFVCTLIKSKYGYSISTVVLLIMNSMYLSRKDDNNTYSVYIVIFSFCISYLLFFVSTFIVCFFWKTLKIPENDNITISLISATYIILIYYFMKIKRLNKGFSFLKQKNILFDFYILNISSIVIFSIIIFVNSEMKITSQTGISIIFLILIILITIQKSFQLYYKQKLKDNELEFMKNEINSKDERIKILEQENLSYSKKMHSLVHKQKSLENKIDKLMMKPEFRGNLDIKENLDNISKNLYTNVERVELPKTDISEIDEMIDLMKEECIKENIRLDLQLNGNIHYMINNLISKNEFEILLADHIKDAIIAIKHTDNINRSILVKIGVIDECYGVYIYDSGIEFEVETLKNLGKKPSTTHADEGGTGMGFMNTFDTIKNCKASLIIKELGKPCKENYTKIIMIKFDNKQEFNIISYRDKIINNKI